MCKSTTSATANEQPPNTHRDIALEIQKSRIFNRPNWAPTIFILALIVVGFGAVAIAALALAVDLRSQVDELNDLKMRLAHPPVIVSTTPPSELNGYTSYPLFEGEWASSTYMPTELSDLGAVLCNGSIVILGGLNSTGGVSDEVLFFDPVFEAYTGYGHKMPTPRFRFGAACLDDKVYVAGGASTYADGNAGRFLRTVDVYDVARNAWSAGAPLPVGRADLALVAHSGAVFAMGGYTQFYPNPDPSMTSNHKLDPSRPAAGWVAMAPLPEGGKGDVSGVAIGGSVYLPGGWNGKFLESNIRYDVALNTWSIMAPMARPRGDKAVTVHDGHIYVIGGETWSGKNEPCGWDPNMTCPINAVPMHSCELYAPDTDTWVNFAPVPKPLFRFPAVAANEIIFTFGGQGFGEVPSNVVQAFLHAEHPDVYLHVRNS